jgi:hypothetical protein
VKFVLIMEVIFCLEKGVYAGVLWDTFTYCIHQRRSKEVSFLSPPFSVLLHDVRQQDQQHWVATW